MNEDKYDVQPIAITLEDLLEVVTESELILEHYVNLWRKEDMEKYKNVVFDILKNGYKGCGGLLGMDSPDQLVAETDLWKLSRKNGKITAAFCYSTKRGGRKTCYGSCTLTPEGKKDMFKMLKDDMEQLGRKVWCEVSDKIEHIYIDKMHVPVIPADVAKMILKDKKIEKIDPDGVHYWRKIGGELKRKIMVGAYDKSLLDIPEE
jgi:hypothetical protein